MVKNVLNLVATADRCDSLDLYYQRTFWKVIYSKYVQKYESTSSSSALYSPHWIYASLRGAHCSLSFGNLVHCFPATLVILFPQLVDGRPISRLLVRGLHSVIFLVHQLSSVLITWPAHVHFNLATHAPLFVSCVGSRIHSYSLWNTLSFLKMCFVNVHVLAAYVSVGSIDTLAEHFGF